MGIQFYEKERVFKLDTPKSSYMIGIVDEENFVGHMYYGRKLNDHQVAYLMRTNEAPFVPSTNNRDRTSFYDCFPMEYPGHGLGDYREDCINIESVQGHRACGFFYQSHRIYQGKPRLQGLPATFGTEQDCSTLELVCIDPNLNVELILLYSVFEDVDAIIRSVRVKNLSKHEVTIRKILSANLDIENQDFELITLHGSWARERHIQRLPLGYGKHGVSSVRGESSHQNHPFLAMAAKKTTEDVGEVYGMHFVYSGNFIAQAELTQFDTVRAVMGIHPCDFSWRLKEGEEFIAPEVALVYSYEGIGGMTRNYHDLYRNHLIRGKYKDRKRPILINNWEATYFDFDTDKLLAIAKQASSFGIEMLVMDDGWFGTRSSDNCALGDWIVNEEKIKGGLKYLVDEVNKLGMEFGIWFEPEMVSPDSDLYRAHPDWAIQIPGRVGSLCRNQYVLDLSRKEVLDYTYESIRKVLQSANIKYVKWDMNRQLSDLGSFGLEKECQGELYHRYVLGVYELQERLVTEFPELLLENCSGGGARFDPGMLYYSPQIWCSDDTDAIERLQIQQGTAMIYPLSSMGAHVSDCPNHTVGRVTPFETRGFVALAGTFGYELDVTKIPEQDREMIPKQVAMYHKYNDLIRCGDYYRIASYGENGQFDCYEVVSKDRKEALVTFIQVMGRPNYHSRIIKFKGLDEEKVYHIEGEDGRYTGAMLMYAGIPVSNLWGDYQGKLIHIVEEK
ncbi:MAG TPA: alpha-galactosidase [Lachnospiraceae bacterium]|nr:alpha-galactosidase [Lachnospiraceae bacterium]